MIVEEEMRLLEVRSREVVADDKWIIVRVDGRGFSKLTDDLEKPFSDVFGTSLWMTMLRLVNTMGAVYAHTHSDEISLLLPQSTGVFGRRYEKLSSVAAGEASAKFTTVFGVSGAFDGRVCECETLSQVQDYFQWRLEDSTRNWKNSVLYWHFRNRGFLPRAANRLLKEMSSADAKEVLIAAKGDLPPRSRFGHCAFWEQEMKKGFNPKTGKETETTRNVMRFQVPAFKGYRDFVKEKICNYPKKN